MTIPDPAGITIRAATADEMLALLAVNARAFGDDYHPERAAKALLGMTPERTLAGFDGATVTAAAGIYTFDMTVPGGPIPVAGVTWVGVLPTHRRRGILSAMMQRQLTGLHEAGGEPVAALWASEPSIYRRFGYGMASRRLGLKLDARLRYVDGVPAATGLRFVELAAMRAAIEPVYESIRTHRPGMLSRTDVTWDKLLDDAEYRREGAGMLNCVTLENGKGYVLYRTKGDFSAEWIPAGKTLVTEFIAADAAAHATLWRFLLDIDLMTTVEAWNCSVDDPVQHFVADGRRIRPVLTDALWVRIVDVERALTARSYTQVDSLVIEVTDTTCPWNTGRYELDVAGTDTGSATVRRTDRAADITMSAVELGAIYLGGTRLRGLAAAGFVDEHTAGAVARADRMFAGDVEPWCPEVF